MFYDINKTLSYNCLFNFIVGPRGTGKTYSAKHRGVKNFINKGEQFIYLRRYQTELDEMFVNGEGKLFKDTIRDKVFPGHKLDNDDELIYVDDRIAGYMIALTKAQHLKSVPFPEISMIIFDEFIIDKGKLTYLNNEVIAFLELYETIARLRNNVVVFFLSNAITVLNPYFIYFDLRLPKDKDIKKFKGDILLELVHNTEFTETKNKTRFGQIIKGTPYGDYAIEAKFLRDNDAFLERKTGTATYFFTFRYKDKTYGVWKDLIVGKMFISKDVDPSCKLIYALTVDDHSPNTMIVKQLKKSPMFNAVLDAFKFSYLYFEDIQIKGAFFEIIKLTIL